MSFEREVEIKRVLISVSDKTGIAEFAKELSALGVEIVSTGGTAKLLEESGMKIRPISDFTGFPEMLDGRVKTLHPKVHGALLAVRDNEGHIGEVKEHGIQLIDMVVINLYPFEKTVARADADFKEVIENIDIGGPSMIRSGAKNFESVTVVISPDQYKGVLGELKEKKGKIGYKKRFELAVEAFKRTSQYDSVIYGYLKDKLLQH